MHLLYELPCHLVSRLVRHEDVSTAFLSTFSFQDMDESSGRKREAQVSACVVGIRGVESKSRFKCATERGKPHSLHWPQLISCSCEFQSGKCVCGRLLDSVPVSLARGHVPEECRVIRSAEGSHCLYNTASPGSRRTLSDRRHGGIRIDVGCSRSVYRAFHFIIDAPLYRRDGGKLFLWPPLG